MTLKQFLNFVKMVLINFVLLGLVMLFLHSQKTGLQRAKHRKFVETIPSKHIIPNKTIINQVPVTTSTSVPLMTTTMTTTTKVVEMQLISPKKYYETYIKIKNRNSKDLSPSTTQQRKTKVLLTGVYRSGSQLIGEFFDFSPDVFYLYEPASVQNKAIYREENYVFLHYEEKFRRWKKDPNIYLDQLTIEIITDIFGNNSSIKNQCKVPWAEQFIDPVWISTSGSAVGYFWKICLEGEICYREKMRLLRTDRYCEVMGWEPKYNRNIQNYADLMFRDPRSPQNITYLSAEEMTGGWRKRLGIRLRDENLPKSRKRRENMAELMSVCPKIDRKKFETDCKTAKHVVVKTKKLRRLELLEDLITKNQNCMSIFYVVRDPRQIAWSRLTTIGDDQEQIDQYIENELKTICDDWYDDLKFLINNSDLLANSSIHFYRYEDVVLNPFENAEEILKLSDIDLTTNLPEINAWINLHLGWMRDNGMFGTTRLMPLRAIDDWKENLPESALEKIYHVKSRCSHMMKFFGYNKFKNVNGNSGRARVYDPSGKLGEYLVEDWKGTEIYRTIFKK